MNDRSRTIIFLTLTNEPSANQSFLKVYLKNYFLLNSRRDFLPELLA